MIHQFMRLSIYMRINASKVRVNLFKDHSFSPNCIACYNCLRAEMPVTESMKKQEEVSSNGKTTVNIGKTAQVGSTILHPRLVEF